MKAIEIQSAREGFWMCAFLLVLASGMTAFWGWYGFDVLRTSERLVRTPCVIQKLSPKTVTSQSPKGGKTTTNYTEVLFEYTVDGKTYQSREFSVWGYSDGSGFEWGDDFGGVSADEMVRRLKEKDVRHCWYDPGKPSYAVLVRTLSYAWLLCGGIVWGCLIFSIAGVYFTQRSIRAFAQKGLGSPTC